MRRRAKGEGTVFWMATKNLWVAQITLPSGKKKAKYSRTQKEVKDWLLEQRKAVKDQAWVDSKSITFGSYLERYMSDVGAHTLRPQTIEAYDNLIRIHIVPELGNIKLGLLQPHHLQKLYSDKINQGLSNRTVQFMHAVIRKALKQAVRWGLIVRNVTDLVEAPKVKKKAFTTWTADQVKQFLRVVREDRLYSLYVLAASTGMREGELLGLYWEDVDYKAGVVSVRRTVEQLKGKGLVLSEPKSEKSKRSIAIPAFALVILRDHQSNQGKTTGLIFRTANNTPFSPRNLVRDFKKHINTAGLPDIRFHDLRHTAATLMLSEGVHPKVVQEILGHSQISLTLDTYSHVLPTLQDDAARKMDTILSP